eukprot:gnl/TRDRNA2_/TRDRNA2_43165_c0_seq1.p1 gnl/TRDRNA2_/TRDRNA2_43165_c0~~gnl/TRDRNA2_/TRDRNA2_43165_c0_seq1.p1  ORF type:complete len:518 (-),score=91.86 gnl/TRDRNA2_/TRDRNA2_43165_c0_seq1:157-1710(-)
MFANIVSSNVGSTMASATEAELSPIIGAADEGITPPPSPAPGRGAHTGVAPKSSAHELSSRKRSPKQDVSAPLEALAKSQQSRSWSVAIFAMVFIGAMCAFLSYFLSNGSRTQALRGSSGSDSYYSVVIDAGSTGSRVHVFRFSKADGRLLDVGGQPSVFRATKPGMSACAGNRSRLHETLVPLLEAASAAVPAEQRSVTPIALRATAGLRMLPGDQAEVLLQEARTLIHGYNFADAGVQVMDGADEGTFQWLAINFLFDALDPKNEPVAVIDLGGGSVQMAYTVRPKEASALSGQLRKDYLREIHLPGQAATAYLYQHSYLGYGLLAARAKMLETAKTAGMLEANPCLPKAAQVKYSYNRQDYTSTGLGEAVNCAKLVERSLHRELQCGGERCSFNGVWAGPGFQRVIASSFFFDRLKDVGSISKEKLQAKATPKMFSEEAAKVCGAPVDPKGGERAEWMCFDLTYAAGLLHDGFGIGMDQQVDVVKEIQHQGRSYGASWALGVALDRLPKEDRSR